jgi:hypothetical protein
MRRLVDSTATSITVSLAVACVIMAVPLGCSSSAKDDTKADRSNEPAPPPPGEEFCETIIPCFQQLDFSGSFSADVTIDIEPNGSVSAVSFTGQEPIPVQTCITDAIKGITLAGYNGGSVRCTQSGQLTGGAQMIMSNRSYKLRDAAPAGAEAGKANAD